eukprot:2660890-Amphidinium_carterae.2
MRISSPKFRCTRALEASVPWPGRCWPFLVAAGAPNSAGQPYPSVQILHSYGGVDTASTS